MADRPQDERARSDTKARKLQSEKEGAKAKAAYEAQADALRAKTERLRALRLAKEEADRQAGIPPPDTPTPKRAKATKQAKPASGKLSDWLEDRQKDGRGY